MPRYYIDVHSHFGTDEDPTGLELPDVAAAKREALKLAGRLMEGWAGRQPAYCSEITIEIVGEDFRPVMAIPYAELKLGTFD